jgi:ornithine cyclodeaminase/alanine dehydrogenase-like protein (mu-crystallin family)
MRYLSGSDLTDLASPSTLVAALEQGLRDFANAKVLVPKRAHAQLGENIVLTMSALSERTIATKIVSVVPSNSARDLPMINGLMTLSDGITGLPVGVLDAAMLTAQRTGALGAVGLKYTTPSDVDRLGIIGTGVQGSWQAIFACAVRPIRVINFLARSDEKARAFADAVGRKVPSVRLSRCSDVIDLLSKSTILIAATSSSQPIFPDDPTLLRNKHFVSVGSFKPSMQELPLSVYSLAPRVVIDSDAATSEVGDIINPLSSGVLLKDNIVHLAQLVAGRRSIQTELTTVFKSVGMALYDLYVARAFLDEANRLGRGISLSAYD